MISSFIDMLTQMDWKGVEENQLLSIVYDLIKLL